MKRNSGLDLYRILCCIGVLSYHVIDDVLGIGANAKVIYFAASYCVPGFFLLSGFLVGSKEEIHIQYFENKILDTVKKWFCWVVFWVVVHFICTGELLDVWSNFTQSVISVGIEPVAWFLFSYCIVMILAYPIYCFMRKWGGLFSAIVGIWIVLLGFGICEELLITRPMCLWLHLYLGYFCAGMVISWLLKTFMTDYSRQKHLYVFSILVCISSTGFYAYQVITAKNFLLPHNYYGEWYYSLWLISLFLICYLLKIENIKMKRMLTFFADNTFTVYLGHLPILLFATSMHSLQSTKEAICCIIVLFLGLEGISWLFRKIPLLRKLV